LEFFKGSKNICNEPLFRHKFTSRAKIDKTINNLPKLIEKPATILGISTDLSGKKIKNRIISLNNVGNFFMQNYLEFSEEHSSQSAKRPMAS
jgi:hypothetical protein